MPIYPNEVCPICNENPNLQYICESCHEVFCEDCVELRTEEQYICLTCGSKNISFNKYDHPYCDDCGGHEVRMANKVLPTCPNCESTQVVRIVDKQRSLIDTYKQIINNTRQFLAPFESILNKLQTFRNKIFEIRQEYPQCYHHPTLESDSLLLFKLFDNGKNRVYDQANRFFQEIQRNIHYINEIQITHPSNLAYISEILNHFERERLKVEKLAKNEVEPLLNRLEPLEDKIGFMERMQSLFNKFLPKLHLDNDEKIVYGLNCKLSSGVNDKQGYSNKNGTILITSKRIYFYHEQGVFKKRTVLLFSVQLSDLQAAEVKGRLKKKVSLQFLNSMYDFSISKNKREIMVDWIERAQEFEVKNIINETHFKQLIKYRLTTKLFSEELENAIYNLVGYHGIFQNRGQVRYDSQSNTNFFNSSMFRANQFTNQYGNNNFFNRHASKFQNYDNNYNNNSNNSNFHNPSFTQYQMNKEWEPRREFYQQNPIHSRGTSNPFTQRVYPGQTASSSSRDNYFSSGANYSQFNQNNTSFYSDPFFQKGIRRDRSQPDPRANNYGNTYFGSSDKFSKFSKFSKSANFGNFNHSRNSNNSNNYSNLNNSNNTSNSSNFKNSPFTSPGSFSQQSQFSQNSPFRKNSSAPFGTSGFSASSFQSFDQSMNNDPFSSEEMNIRAELERLRSDQYAFQNTLQKLEYQYDRGVISNPEFVKSYQDLLREYYIITNKIQHLEGYLHENYEI
ncbi:PH domain-containing protein [Candidatus Harpocratesius sp.]